MPKGRQTGRAFRRVSRTEWISRASYTLVRCVAWDCLSCDGEDAVVLRVVLSFIPKGEVSALLLARIPVSGSRSLAVCVCPPSSSSMNSQLRIRVWRARRDTSATFWTGALSPGAGISQAEYPTARFSCTVPALSLRAAPDALCPVREIVADWTDLLMLKAEKSEDFSVEAGSGDCAGRDAGSTVLTLLRNFSKEDGWVAEIEAVAGCFDDDCSMLLGRLEGEGVFGLRPAMVGSGEFVVGLWRLEQKS